MKQTDLFDNYLNRTLSFEDKIDFEIRLNNDKEFSMAFEEHRQLVSGLKSYGKRITLQKQLAAIHQKEKSSLSKNLGSIGAEILTHRNSRLIAVAATTALVAVLSTIAVLSTGGYLLKKQSNQITELKREVLDLKYSSEAIVTGINKNNKKVVYAPANLEGTAFAINNGGCILTSYHMVKGADSIYIQNGSVERMSATLIYSDPKLDLAVLKVEVAQLSEKEPTKNWQVPFAFSEKSSEIGEKLFTVGYPRKDMVYGEGSLSALSGIYNDTSMYQISIPVNPGNSGGPLLDENGNIIGLIRGKMTGAEGTGFAVKASQIIRSFNAITSDSLRNQILAQGYKKNGLKGLKRTEQVKRLSPFVFNVLVYKKD
jgi:serine protease Do